MTEILRFTATWCGPCKMLAKTLESIDTNVPIKVVDVDEEPRVAILHNIRNVPTLVMLEEGKEVKRISGNKTKQELEEFINV